MVDVVDQATRSRMMAGIQGKDTKPEILIRKALHAKGFRYTLHAKGLPGKPDIVMPKWRVVIFVHGCFWHLHGCALSKMPSNNAEFWATKLTRNKHRDDSVKQQLSALGWRTATVWECGTRGSVALVHFPKLIDHLADWIRNQAESRYLELGATTSPHNPTFHPANLHDIQINRSVRWPRGPR